MSKTSRVPAPLEPFLCLPPELSLLFFTGTLGCSPTWLLSRHVAGVLGDPWSRTQAGEADETPGPEDETAVILVSWLRDEAFWRTELRRCCGLDTPRLTSQNRYTFIPALSLKSRTPNLSSLLPHLPQHPPSDQQSRTRKTHLILDTPDPLLYLSTPTNTAQSLATQLLNLRTRVHSCSILTSADEPLLSAATVGGACSTPLEIESAGFLTALAWQARWVLACRELGTGAARDVSGVLRVTRGGGWDEEEDVGDGRLKEAGLEALYLVQRDGRVEVFERGAVTGG